MDIYMKYPGIKGPVTGNYQGSILLLTLAITIRENSYVIEITKGMDSANAELYREAVTNADKKEVIIEYVVNDEIPPLKKLVLENTVIESYTLLEDMNISLTLNCTKITVSYNNPYRKGSQHLQNEMMLY